MYFKRKNLFMITTILLALVCLFWLLLMAMQKYDIELIISPIMGFMFGALYDREADYNKYYHTVQIVLLFVAFTFTWETNE